MFKSIFSLTILVNAMVIFPTIARSLGEPAKNSQIFVNSEQIAQSSLGKSEIKEFIKNIETFVNLGRRKQLIESIEPNANLDFTSAVGDEPLAVTLVTLIQVFREDVPALKDYKVKLNIKSIEIQGNTAKVTGTSVDKAVIEGGKVINTDEQWTGIVSKRAGKLVVSQWQSRMVGYSIRAK